MVQIGNKVWEVSVSQDDNVWSFRCEDSTSDIVEAFEGASTALITRLGSATTYFDPQLLSVSQDFQKNRATVRFSVKPMPDDVVTEIDEDLEDANAALVELAEYAASLEERIAALEGADG